MVRLGVPVSTGFAPEHVPSDTDVVVVGNAALRDNVEAAEAARRGLSVLSLPQAVREYLLPGRISVVITGTHGKTTTSALTSWLLLDSGRDPGFLVGGEMKNLGRGYRLGHGAHFVLEGDEYNAAFFDFLEKDTNSGFNEWERRHQQMAVANAYYQDFPVPGYTVQFSYHFNRDEATRFFGRPAALPRSILSYLEPWPIAISEARFVEQVAALQNGLVRV